MKSLLEPEGAVVLVVLLSAHAVPTKVDVVVVVVVACE